MDESDFPEMGLEGNRTNEVRLDEGWRFKYRQDEGNQEGTGYSEN